MFEDIFIVTVWECYCHIPSVGKGCFQTPYSTGQPLHIKAQANSAKTEKPFIRSTQRKPEMKLSKSVEERLIMKSEQIEDNIQRNLCIMVRTLDFILKELESHWSV